MELYNREMRLTDDLKNLCSKKGKEIDKRKTAPILHELGLIYRQRSPDKIRLLQSAGLFNAATVRCPSNPQYVDSLRQLCSHVLELANAKNLESDLIAISREVKEKIMKMRGRVKESLSWIKEIPFHVSNDDELWILETEKVENVRLLQTYITEDYRDIMDFISQNCLQILGHFPCNFALVGMGSLARKEITPYSDFEHVIVLKEGVQEQNNYKKILEYFRWYSVIFITILINLQETILRFLAIPSLNDPANKSRDWFYDAHTPCGISPDGFAPAASKIPLGRTQPTKYKPWTIELIKPVSEMVKFLSKEESLKNGYNLSDVLTKTCFVSGDFATYKKYANEVKLELSQNRKFNYSEAQKQIAKNLEQFNIENLLSNSLDTNVFDIKRFVYRTLTLIISSLGRHYSINKHSCLDVIEEIRNTKTLEGSQAIHDEAAHYLSYAVAIACEARLKTYMCKKGQDDFIGPEYADFLEPDKALTEELVTLVGERNLVDYFTIAFQYQKEGLNSCTYNEIRRRHLMKFKALLSLRLHRRNIQECEAYITDEIHSNSDDNFEIGLYLTTAYKALGQFDKAIQILRLLQEKPSTNSLLNHLASQQLATCLVENMQCTEATPLFERVIAMLKEVSSKDRSKIKTLSYLLSLYARCKTAAEDYKGALAAYRDAQRYQIECLAPWSNTIRASFLKDVSYCLYKVGKFEQAISRLFEASSVRSTSCLNEHSLSTNYILMGDCYSGKKKFQTALFYYSAALRVASFLVPREQEDLNQDTRETKKLIIERLNKLSSLSQRDVKSGLARYLIARVKTAKSNWESMQQIMASNQREIATSSNAK